MENPLRSKIIWINVIGFLVAALPLLSDVFPEQTIYIGLAINLLTIILRQLQGVEVNIGGKKITL